jgi:hypothetical protein
MSERIRDMLFERRHRHLPGHAPRRAYCRLDGWRLIVGVQSAHRTNAARKLRTQLRLIRARAAAEIGRGMVGSNVRAKRGQTAPHNLGET